MTAVESCNCLVTTRATGDCCDGRRNVTLRNLEIEMDRHELKDRYGRLLGTMDTNVLGRVELTDWTGRRVGTYDPRDNTTVDAQGRLQGQGNLLASLLPPKN